MISREIGRLFSAWRDAIARGLLRAGARPNTLTVLGMLLTVGAGLALAAGRAYWLPGAATLLVLAGACDLLDGAMAKLGNLGSRFGGVLDSVCDRVGDAALYFGMVLCFVLQPDAPRDAARPNLTLSALAMMGLLWAYLISYIRARAAAEGAHAGGGFWQRPERVVTILLGAAFGHVATAVWILGIWPLTTVAHRIWRAWRACGALDAGHGTEAPAIQPAGLLGPVLWRWPRGTVPFDIHAGTVILMLVLWNVPPADPLRAVLAWWVGA